MKMKKCLTVATILVSLVMYSCSKDESTVAPNETDSIVTPEIPSVVYIPRLANDTSSAYITTIIDYSPAPGQYINGSSFGTLEKAQEIIGKPQTNMITLGMFGGYIIFSFDHSIKDTTGADIAIYGNPLPSPNIFSEPGIVMVSYDANNNGKADDSWYELAGSNYDSSNTIKNYAITYYNSTEITNIQWKDNQGNSGLLKYTGSKYPNFIPNQDSITYKGTLLPNTLSSSGLVRNFGFNWGYSDSYSLGLDPYGYDNYKENKYNSFDISWARDSAGNSIKLKYIDFIKVYTGQFTDAGILGEISTEVKGAADLHILNK